MTDEIPAAQDLDDAKLLNLVRAGDTGAYEVLFQRHEQAARRLARDLVVSPAEIDGVVAETFARVLDVMRTGGGPTDAFRPYILTAARRVCYDRLESQRRQIPTARESGEPGDPFVDAAVASLDESLIARAFMSLPERWSAILWHTEIERASLAEIAPIFGLTRNGVAASRQRAKEGLRQAYLRMHVSTVSRPECKPVAERLGAFARDALPGPDAVMVSEHLSECGDCQAVSAELSDLNSALRGVVAPIFLGSAATSYLASTALSALSAHTGTAAGTGAVSSTAASLPAGAGAAGGAVDSADASGNRAASLTTRGGATDVGSWPLAIAGLTGVAGLSAQASGGRAGAGVPGSGSATSGASAGGPPAGGPPAAGALFGGGAMGGPAMGGAASDVAAPGGALVSRGAGGPPGSTALVDMFAGPERSPRRRSTGPLQWIAAGAGVVVAVFAIAFAVTLTGHNSSASPGGHHKPVALAASPALVTTSSHAPSPTAKPSSTRPASTSPAATPTGVTSSSASQPAHPTPTPGSTPPTQSPTVELAASVSVLGDHGGNFVSFQVMDSGSAQTGELTVAVTLPSGASMGSGSRDSGQLVSDGGYGWSCQPTSSGATCQHDPISAGAQATGWLVITLSGTSACGQPVQITATSGAASASAQSSSGISC